MATIMTLFINIFIIVTGNTFNI